MFPPQKFLILSTLMLFACFVNGQRNYRSSSALANGNWYKISISAEGVYKIDVALLSLLGITGSIPSAQVRIFGNGGAMLSEANAQIPIDDLEENAIMVIDGGDGLLNGSDYVLFFSQGPDKWIKDSANKRFFHQKNLYGDKAYYYITIGGTGKRISNQTTSPGVSATVTSFDERYFPEFDTVNFLSSGKEWYGEEFSGAPGKTLNRAFTLPFSDILSGSATIISMVAARSLNVASGFTVSVNGQPVQQITIPQVGSGIYDLFAKQSQKANNFVSQANAIIDFSYTPGSFNSQGWLNGFEFFCRRNLSLTTNGQLLFRDWSTVNTSGAEFVISNAGVNTQVWDVSSPLNPLKMNSSLSGNQFRFSNDAQQLHEYACFSTSFLLPQAVGKVAPQNLYATSETDFFIVTYPSFLPQAQRLAQFHQQQNNLRTVVVTTDQVYNEFSSGIADPTAIRDFVKMYYDKYRTTWTQSAKYLLLFGKASYDYKNRILNNTNLVAGYESNTSLDPLSTYTSDDFFGFLDDNEDINSGLVTNQMDIGIGRVPAKDVEEAKNFVDKILDYHSAASLGPWRNNLNFIADDEDLNLHLQDAETLTSTVSLTAPLFNQQKIYLDAFQQESAAAGGRYPQANSISNNNFQNGTLLWNFSGHGGSQRLAEEVILDQSTVNAWSNQYRLPLFITATCDFAPYDNPVANSLGENLLVRPKTGAIALMTTTRVVFAYTNRIINENYLKLALQPSANGRYKTLGEAMMAAKNYTYQTSSDIINNRKFALLGDPAMSLGFPAYKVNLTKVNGQDIAAQDTLGATESVMIEGEIDDNSGALQNTFKGTVYLSLFDKVKNITTLANDPGSVAVIFQDQSNILFKGKASVQNGQFIFRFRLPKDINYQFGNGKVSLYAEDGSSGGSGYSTNIIIGGIAGGNSTDNTGPEINAYLNDDKFVNGSITNSTPILLLRLSDSSGINTVSSGLGHDIIATLDNNNNTYFILNNFYESELDNYQKGTVRFQLPLLEPGHHFLKIKAWDVLNNSNEYLLNFTVVESSELKIDHVLNYPNPFTTKTSFWFEHNRPGTDLYTKAEIFTLSGRLIKTLSQTINSPGNRSNEIMWDGRDEYGNKIGRGVYIYRLRVRTFDGKTADKWERLVVL